MKFSDIYGHNHLKETLLNSVKKDHVAHALLFAGKSGSANLALALAFAQYVNCENPLENDSCGSCPSCLKIEKLAHPDLMMVFPSFSSAGKEGEVMKANQVKAFKEWVFSNPFFDYEDWVLSLDGDKKQCIISVDEGRNIARYVSMKAFEAKYKIVLIWLPEMMNQSCANSILKILEEPPAKTLYLLVSNDYDKNIITIQSRTQMVNVPLFQLPEIDKYLQDKFFLSPKQAKHIAKFSDGSMREALKLTKNEEDANLSWFIEWMRISYKADMPQIIKFSEDFSKMTRGVQISVLKEGLEIGREIMIHQAELTDLKRISEEDEKFLVGFAKLFDYQKLQEYIELLTEAMFHIERNLNVKLVFVDTSFKLAKILRRK